MVKFPKENGWVQESKGLFGLLAPLANTAIFPCSFVRITSLLSYSPMGMADKTIPITIS